MKKIFIGLLFFVSFIKASEEGSELARQIAEQQVAQIRELVLNSTESYDSVAENFFSNYNYHFFIGPNSSLDGLTKEVRDVLEAKRKRWGGTKTKAYRRLQLLHSFLAVAQQKDPFKAYELELKVKSNESLRSFHAAALDSSKKITDLKSGHWAANGTVLVVAHDVARRRGLNEKPFYE